MESDAINVNAKYLILIVLRENDLMESSSFFINVKFPTLLSYLYPPKTPQTQCIQEVIRHSICL